MFSPRALLLAPLALLVISSSPLAHAIEAPKPLPHYNGFMDFLLKDPLLKPHLPAETSDKTNFTALYNHSNLHNIQVADKTLSGCLESHPYAARPIMAYASQGFQVMNAHGGTDVRQLAIQPHFSGLKGPKLTIMRDDLQHALEGKGSANEIYHNTIIHPTKGESCDYGFSYNYDIEINHHIDSWDSDQAPLVRSEAVVNARQHIGGYFLGTVSANYLLYDTLYKEPKLRTLNRPDPVRQDVIGYLQKDYGLKRMMLSGFYTPKEDFYIAAHAGYLEEMFFGVGGEFLYRPYDKALSLGGEVWSVAKRIPYAGTPLTLATDDRFNSALFNIWYDAPAHPFAVGLSAGHFLDGDLGYQIRTRYTPAKGWKAEGYATYSSQSDATVNKDEDTHWIFGARLSMPLGNIRGIPENSRQTVTVAPFARDHGQRLDNPYPLYDLTDAWSKKNILEDWALLNARTK